MDIKKLTFNSQGFPKVLRDMASPPDQLYQAGAPLNKLLERPAVAIVGSRKMSPYGRQVTARLAGELAEQGVVIISGLAYGVDALAHQAALEAGGLAIAVLPSPLDNIAPVGNRGLARDILERGGALVTEYPAGEPIQVHFFIARNRLVSGLADAVLIPEAAEKSGSLYTANFANEQGKEVLAVPGNINSLASVGTNSLIKAGHAGAVTSTKDVLNSLGLQSHQTHARDVKGRNAHEQTLLDLMLTGLSDGHLLLEGSGLTASQFAQTLTMLELGGKIRALGANHWGLS